MEGLLALASSNFSANGGSKWKMVIKAFILMVNNSLMLVMIKLLVRLLVSQVTRHLAAVMSVFKLICPVLW